MDDHHRGLTRPAYTRRRRKRGRVRVSETERERPKERAREREREREREAERERKKERPADTVASPAGLPPSPEGTGILKGSTRGCALWCAVGSAASLSVAY